MDIKEMNENEDIRQENMKRAQIRRENLHLTSQSAQVNGPLDLISLDMNDETAVIQAAINAFGVSYCKLDLNYKKAYAKKTIPSHAFSISADNRTWTDDRTGETGDVVELYARNCGATRIDSARAILKTAKEWAEKGASPFPDETLPDDPRTDEDFWSSSFPVESLPRTLREMVEEMCKVEQLSPVLSSMCCLGAVSAALGNKIQIETINDLTVFGNLYMTASAGTSTGKSTACNRAYKPLREFQADYLVEFDQNILPNLKIRLDELRKQASDPNIEPTKKIALTNEIISTESQIMRPCLLAMDATSEKLAEMMARNGGAIAMLGGESRAAVDMLLGRYRNKGDTDESLYISAYSADAYTQSRISRGTVNMEAPCLTLLWHLQPDKFNDMMMKPNLSASGFLCRMLLCDSRAVSPGVSPYGIKFSDIVQERYSTLLKDLLEVYRLSKAATYTVKLDYDAWTVFSRYRTHCSARAEFSLDFMKGFVGRWAENAFRMALVFHAVEHGKRAHLQNVSEQTAWAAVNAVSWFAHEQVKLLSEAAASREDVVREKINAYLTRNPGTSIRTIARGVNSTADDVRDILEALIQEGLVKTERRHGPGRSTTVYCLNKGKK